MNNELDSIYNKLDTNTKKEYLKNECKRQKNKLITINVIFIILIAYFSLLLLSDVNIIIPFIIFESIIVLAYIFTILFTKKYYKNLSDELKIKKQILIIKKQKEREEKLNIKDYKDDENNIKSVKIIDSWTEYKDKLHAILNYQEIMQERIYKIQIIYKNGSSEIINVKEGSKKYNLYMKYVISENSNTIKENQEPTEELKKYKQLLDDGIITEEEFEKKKKQILGL